MSDFEAPVTSEELGRMLKRSPTSITDMARRGVIPGFKLGRSWRFLPSKVMAHLDPPKDTWSQPVRALRARRVS